MSKKYKENFTEEKLKKIVKLRAHKAAIRVTFTMDYLIPHYESKTPEEIAKEWFEDFQLYGSHAYRDGSKIGHSEQVVKVKIIK